MSINIGPPSVEELRPRITVIGVGGAGGNAIANMIESEIEGVEFIVANTDAQALNNAAAEHRIQLGPDITQGLGAGSRPEVGRAAAEETVEDIERALEGVNMVFIAAGMGGGTGTGAAPVIAETARSKGILTVGVVTKPFLFEGTRRMRAAEAGIEELQKHVDTLIVIPNQNLFLVAKAETTFKEAFILADEVLQQGVRSITDLMVMPGLINLDFADIRSVMNEMGKAMMGTGEGEGENRALEAAEHAIANPLLDGVSMQGAKGVIISIIGGEDMKLLEVDEAANHIRELVDPEANIIWGSAFNPELEGKIRVSVVATGIEQSSDHARSAGQPGFGASRGPKRPARPLPQVSEPEDAEPSFDEDRNDEFAASFDLASHAQEEERETAAGTREEQARVFDPPTPSGYDADDEDQDEQGETRRIAEPADDSEFGGPAAEGFASRRDVRENSAQEGRDRGRDPAPDHDEGDDAAFELTQELDEEEEGPGNPGGDRQDELLLDASRLAQADRPVGESPAIGRRRPLVSDGEETGSSDEAPRAPAERKKAPASPAGSTLFERMASLSRSGASGDEDDSDDDDDSGSMRIPRFLGRQNNQ